MGNPIDCITSHAGASKDDMINSYKKHLNDGLSEKEAARKVVLEQHEKIHNELNDLRKQIKVKPEAYTPHDNTEELKKINEEYNKKIAESSPQPQQGEGAGKSYAGNLITPIDNPETVSTSKLKKDAGVTFISEEKQYAIQESVSKEGVKVPIIVNKENGDIIDGSHRLSAAIKAGQKDIPVIYVKDLQRKDGSKESQDLINDIKNKYESKANEQNKSPQPQQGEGQTLYHFTTDSEKLLKEGFKSGERMDSGIGGDGASLHGTYFFTDPNDLSKFSHWTATSEGKAKESGTKASLIEAVLDKDAKVLDSYSDKGKELDRLRGEFIESITGGSSRYISAEDKAKLKSSVGELNSPEFNKNFTKFLRDKGYDAVRLYSNNVAGHEEVVVINEAKLKINSKANEQNKSPQAEKVKQLEQERDENVGKAQKPEIKMPFIKPEELVNSHDPLKFKEKHTEIKDKYKTLKQIIECLWS